MSEYNPPMAFHRHRNRWPRMAILREIPNSEWNCLTWMLWFWGMIVLKQTEMRIYMYCQGQRCSPRSVVSGDIRLVPIFIGVRRWGGVKWECGRRKCELSSSIAISFVTLKFPTDFTYWNLYGFARFPCDSTDLVEFVAKSREGVGVTNVVWQWVSEEPPHWMSLTLSAKAFCVSAPSSLELTVIQL